MSFFKKILGSKDDNKAQDITPNDNNQENETTDSLENSSAISLSENDILLSQAATDKDQAINIIAETMFRNGYTVDNYADAMIAREEQVSTYLINGVAIPHGNVDNKHRVKTTGIVVAQFPEGVVWNEKQEKVYLAVGIAAKGDEHMEILMQLTNVVQDENLSHELGQSANAEKIALALGQTLEPSSNDTIATDYDIAVSVNIADEAGIHARPATLISEMAQQYENTDIQLRRDNKAANAKSMADILTLGGKYHDELVISAQGDEAKSAIDYISAAIAKGLDSPEEDGNNNNANYQAIGGLPNILNLFADEGITDNSNEQIAQQVLLGSAASPGIAQAPIYILPDHNIEVSKEGQGVEAESEKSDNALNIAHQQLAKLHDDILATSSTEAAIFKAQQQLLKDPTITSAISTEIKAGNSASWSWQNTLQKKADELNALDDERLKARSADIIDISNRLITILENKDTSIQYPNDDFILVAKDLSPSQTATLGNYPIKAIVTELGGPNSHMAILARALGIPAVVGVANNLVNIVKNGQPSIVDPQSSSFLVNPSSQAMAKATESIKMWHEIKIIEEKSKHKKAVTTDGVKIDVVCNIAKPEDAQQIIDNGGEGVGLLRTEFLFESSTKEPTIDEQVDALKTIADKLEDKILIVRTADIGGDKPVSWLDMPLENNPFLGVRGIRLSFNNEEMFRNQLKAIYKTAIYQQEKGIKSGIHIMFPMVSLLSEWRLAKQISESVREELNAPELPLGIMVETPSAAILADAFAKEVDFFSIGSNDLTQYTLAMDRLHPVLAKKADSFSPALLRLINMTVEAAKANNKWVGVCGNMAADPNMAAILIGLGVKELSISPVDVPKIKHFIQSVSFEKLKNHANNAIACGSIKEVKALYQDNNIFL